MNFKFERDNGFLDWVFKEEYNSEFDLLYSLLEHTENWYNELTEPLKDFLLMVRGFSVLVPEQYVEIAQELYYKKLESNHGNYLLNTIQQMSDEEIPLFNSRYSLRKYTQEFLESGYFIKDIVSSFNNWHSKNERSKHIATMNVRRGWEKFKFQKDRLIEEINRQIRRHKQTLEKYGELRHLTNILSILFISADPTDLTRIRLGKEIREIQEKIQLSKFRDRIIFYQRMSARSEDISQSLLDINPTIVHFSGHGTSSGALCFEDNMGKTHPITSEALSALFQQFSKQLQCVILNACYSETQAKSIARHIPFVIGMNDAISDSASIAFSVGFYQSLGAGRSIREAYELGCIQIQLQGISGHLIPTLESAV